MSDEAPPPAQVAEARAHRLLPAQQFNLNRACAALVDAFGWNVYQVGSSLRGGPWRDVDVRCILDDEEFDRMFPGAFRVGDDWPRDARLALLNVVTSEWLSARTGLPVDFQFQRRTQANEKYGRPDHQRSALGIFLRDRSADEVPGG